MSIGRALTGKAGKWLLIAIGVVAVVAAIVFGLVEYGRVSSQNDALVTANAKLEDEKTQLENNLMEQISKVTILQAANDRIESKFSERSQQIQQLPTRVEAQTPQETDVDVNRMFNQYQQRVSCLTGGRSCDQ